MMNDSQYTTLLQFIVALIKSVKENVQKEQQINIIEFFEKKNALYITVQVRRIQQTLLVSEFIESPLINYVDPQDLVLISKRYGQDIEQKNTKKRKVLDKMKPRRTFFE